MVCAAAFPTEDMQISAHSSAHSVCCQRMPMFIHPYRACRAHVLPSLSLLASAQPAAHGCMVPLACFVASCPRIPACAVQHAAAFVQSDDCARTGLTVYARVCVVLGIAVGETLHMVRRSWLRQARWCACTAMHASIYVCVCYIPGAVGAWKQQDCPWVGDRVLGPYIGVTGIE